MNVFEMAIHKDHSVTDAYNDLWAMTNGFTLITVDELIKQQRWYLYNSKSLTTTKLLEFLCIEGRLPIHDPEIYRAIFSRDQNLYRNMFDNAILNLICFDVLNYEVATINPMDMNFLAGMAKNRQELADYVENSIEVWISRNECINNMSADMYVIRDKVTGQKLSKPIDEEIKTIVKEGFLTNEFVVKPDYYPLHLMQNPTLQMDLMYYLSGIHQHYSTILYNHPYYYDVADFINSIVSDVEDGIYFGILEYFLDDNERKVVYDEEIDAIIYVYLTFKMKNQ